MRTANTTLNESTGTAIVASYETPCDVRISNPGTGSEVFYVSFQADGGQGGIPLSAGQSIPLRLAVNTPLYGTAKTGGGSVASKTTFTTQQPN